MTTLAITPNWKNKSAKFKGTVAAGEHVSVTIQNNDGEGGEFIDDASTLRLRVVGMDGRTLAIFPEPVPEGETPETWDSDLSPLRCTLNLNTVQMLKAVPPAANVSLLWVLDDYDNNTLYFKEQFPVEHWPRLRGEEEPTDLDNYKDIIADFNTRLDGYDTRITGAENAAQAATANASAANGTANEAKAIANDAVGVAQQAKEAAETSQESAAASATAAQNAAEAAIAAAESINSPDATLTEEGVAADAKAAGEAIAAEKERAETAEAAEETRAKGVESGLRTDLTAAQKAIDDEAVLRAAADADLEANKADKATTYTKTEVDTKIAGVQTFKKYLVQTLPDPDEADMKGLYLVPTGETSEEGDLCEEWTVVEEDGEKRWELIGGTTVDLDDYYTKTETDALVTLTPIYSQTPTFSEWTFESLPEGTTIALSYSESENLWMPEVESDYWSFFGDGIYSSDGANALSLTIGLNHLSESTSVIARRTRTDILGYVLGSQSDKRLASEAEAEALRTAVAGKQDTLSAQQLANIEAVPGKLDKSGGTMTGSLVVTGSNAAVGVSDGTIIVTLMPTKLMVLKPSSGSFPLVYNFAFPDGSGTLALTSDIPDVSGKANATDLAPAFSTSATYAVGEHVTYNGKLYKCTTAVTTAGAWDASKWTADTMTDALHYDRITITTGQLQDHAVQKVTLNAATTTLTLPALTDLTGKVSDFGIDMVNAYEVSDTPTAASFSLAGTIGTDYNLIVPDGEDWSEMSALAAGEMAQFYFTLSSFQLDSKPTWKVVKQVVQKVTIPTVTP